MIKLSLISATALSFMLSTAHALPGGGDGTSGTKASPPAKTSPKALKCKRGETVKRVKKNGKFRRICVKLKAGILDDNELYQQARALADAHEYEWALDHLKLITTQRDPKVLTYTGYTHRKAGRLETGIGFYQQALAIKPDYAEAREYLGEAYVLAGYGDRATAQLVAIRSICGTDCEAYRALADFIANQQP